MNIIIPGILSVFILASIPRTIEYVAPEPEPIINQYDVELTRWVEKLAKCESSNNPNAINHFDGGSESIGYVQYKRTTWAMYNKKFGLSYTEEDIWSREAQIEMTKAVIKNDYAWRNWYNCSNNPATPNFAGLPPKYENQGGN